MELHQLQCFLAVLEEGGFKRATARLGMTQPALSYQIKRLEEELDVQLFHRRPGGVALTDAGRALLEHAHQVIATVQDAHHALRELSEGATAELRVGTINCLGTYFLPRVLWEVRARHPTIRPKLLYRHPEELLECVLASQLDVAIVPDPPLDARLRQELVLEDRISLVSSRGHPFYGRTSVEAAELGDVQLVAMSLQTSTGALIRRHLDRLGVRVTPAFSADDVDTVKMMVEEGMGVAFLPDMVTQEDVAADGSPARLARSAVEPPLAMHLAIVTRIDTHPSSALEAFVEEVRVTAQRSRAGRGAPRGAEFEI